MSKFYVTKIERSSPNKTGNPVYGYIVSELTPDRYAGEILKEVIAEASELLSLEFNGYSPKTPLNIIIKEIHDLINENTDEEIYLSDIAFSNIELEVNNKAFQDMMDQPRYRYEYENAN